MHATKFVESYFDAWNHRDARLVADHLTADGMYCDIPSRQQHSRKELLANLTEFFTSSNHQYELIGDILTGRTSIAFQYRVSRSGAFADTFFGAEFVTLDGEGAISILDYYSTPDHVRGVEHTSLVSSGAFARKYTKSGLGNTQMENYKHQLEKLMDIEMEFLKPNLTLPGLAAIVGCSVNHLSQVINSGFGMSFFDYLNQHRVEYAKRLLSSRNHRDWSVLSIALAAGFNSNSSFYAAFRKASGQTPARFRQSQKMSEKITPLFTESFKNSNWES
jgi:AraC-like DNA-binding protein